MRKPGFIRDEILMVVGVVLIGLAGLALLGLSLDKGSKSRSKRGPQIFSGLILLGGVAAFSVGRRFRRKEKQLRRVLTVLRSSDSQVSIASLAATSGYPKDEVRNSVIFLISHGFVALKLDADRDEVYSPRDRRARGKWLKLPGTCPNCDAPTPTVIEGTDSPVCEYCDAPLPAQRMEPEQPDQVEPARGSADLHKNVFAGSWVVLVVLFVVCWPAAVAYLMHGLKRHGGVKVFRPY